jgi:hypothetical protein
VTDEVFFLMFRMVKLSGGMVREADEGDDNQKSKTWGCHARA